MITKNDFSINDFMIEINHKMDSDLEEYKATIEQIYKELHDLEVYDKETAGIIASYAGICSEYDSTCEMIGVLVASIGNYWGGGVDGRLSSIIVLSYKLNEQAWIDWIDEHNSDVVEDGRWMREWPGPYGGSKDNVSTDIYKLYECEHENSYK
jgi:hypothetical protein